MMYRAPLRWPRTLAGADRFVHWGQLISIVGSPSTGKATLASRLAEQVLARHGVVAWINARNTATPSQLFQHPRDNLLWVEGPQANNAELAEQLLRARDIDMVVLDALDAFWRAPEGRVGLTAEHPALIVNRLIRAAQSVRGTPRIVVILNHLWNTPRGHWMPGRQALVTGSSQYCVLRTDRRPELCDRLKRGTGNPLWQVGATSFPGPYPADEWTLSMIDLGRDGLG